MTDTMTHSSKIPHFSKRQLLRKGVLNSLLVSALGLYVATTPPTFGVDSIAGGSSAADSGNASAPTAHASDIEISDTEKAGWKTWIKALGKPIDHLRNDPFNHKLPLADWKSFCDDSFPQWNNFLAQHGPALAAREPYYQEGSDKKSLIATLKKMANFLKESADKKTIAPSFEKYDDIQFLMTQAFSLPIFNPWKATFNSTPRTDLEEFMASFTETIKLFSEYLWKFHQQVYMDTTRLQVSKSIYHLYVSGII